MCSLLLAAESLFIVSRSEASLNVSYISCLFYSLLRRSLAAYFLFLWSCSMPSTVPMADLSASHCSGDSMTPLPVGFISPLFLSR